MSPSPQRIVELLTSGDGTLFAAALLFLVVAIAKRYPALEAYLKTPTQKRVFAAAISVLPVIGLALVDGTRGMDLVRTAMLAFISATGLHHLLDPVPTPAPPPPPVPVPEELAPLVAPPPPSLPPAQAA